MRDLSLSILDIVENSIAAKATKVKISVEEDLEKDQLRITITDNGRGIDGKYLLKVTDPFVTTKPYRRVGLGLSLLKTKAQQCHGDLTISSQPGEGTTVKVVFQYGHIDRPPLGDIASTLACIILANPGLDVLYQHTVGNVVYRLDTRRIKKMAGKNHLRKKDVLALISRDIEEGLSMLEKERRKVFKQIFGYLPRVELA